ncbi:hypothetical protein LCGC14_0464630 [marine sediment metagenome]|uniref:Methyltransferase type 11 domain-containing protein n=1 Tax=marine sediment metagenome TaxID=412755 RepID=A0A0F9V0R2_9ZZZZ
MNRLDYFFENAKGKVLYIGCYMRPPINIASTYLSLFPSKDMTGLDLVMEDAALNIKKGDALKPFGVNEYDTIIAGELLEHFDKEEAKVFVSNCWKALKEDGELILTTPNLEALLNRLFHKFDNANCGGFSPHKVLYTIHGIKVFLNDQNFIVNDLFMLPYDEGSSPDLPKIVYVLRSIMHNFLPDSLRENIVVKARKK